MMVLNSFLKLGISLADMQEQCASILRKLSGKKHVLFVKRGNSAIKLALKLAKSLGHDKVLVQDQGGWLTYKQFCEKEKMRVIELKTDYGLVNPEDLRKYPSFVLLISSMAGYAALQDMKSVAKICKEQGIFIINDASGSIGTAEAKAGDIILASFAIDKPVNIDRHGGFIATDNPKHFEFLKDNNQEYDIDFTGLLGRLQGLSKRLSEYKSIRDKLIHELEASEFANKIIHKDKSGINVIVRFDNEAEKEKLINLGLKEGLEHTLCPREIRVLVDAVSFEIKRR
ncbi:MAG TPA: DegT/DnrJ/EryC1/StrS family aminotransferase [Candidatus Nanoarchaeia archaeon]|nr:DegT/DnrJ/EryC1/StrS family aminotransferase [Candidatus Nanoarchaeia archaeon]